MCEYDEKMVFPTIDDDGDGGRRMVGYEGYRFPEMSLDELEAYFLRCMKGAQSFVDEQGSDVDDSILSVLSTAGNALIVCRMMRHSLTEYEKDQARRKHVLRFVGRKGGSMSPFESENRPGRLRNALPVRYADEMRCVVMASVAMAPWLRVSTAANTVNTRTCGSNPQMGDMATGVN